MLIIFSTKPVFAISIILNLLLAKTMVFGGVPTGIIKAIDAESVAAIINIKGLTPMATETDARIGKTI